MDYQLTKLRIISEGDYHELSGGADNVIISILMNEDRSRRCDRSRVRVMQYDKDVTVHCLLDVNMRPARNTGRF